ncbi:hypothetical protein ACFYVR_16070 [Rhodococcus sp. NPDC003318]|uniref:hypothetical protein n=1 Tax=Rhodococcus sp. NPDC003318 TaxID=3364503 RepID=UPI0036B531F9
MEQIAGIAVADLGLSGLLALAVLLILVGALIPRPVHKVIVAIKDDIINDQRERLRELERQVDRLISGTSTSVHIAESIHEKAYENPSGAGDS